MQLQSTPSLTVIFFFFFQIHRTFNLVKMGHGSLIATELPSLILEPFYDHQSGPYWTIGIFSSCLTFHPMFPTLISIVWTSCDVCTSMCVGKGSLVHAVSWPRLAVEEWALGLEHSSRTESALPACTGLIPLLGTIFPCFRLNVCSLLHSA